MGFFDLFFHPINYPPIYDTDLGNDHAHPIIVVVGYEVSDVHVISVAILRAL